MSLALRSCAVLLAAATAASTADPVAEELFQRAREKVLDNTRRMPRYTCVETIYRTQYRPPDNAASCESLIAMRRLATSRGNLMARDRLRLDVAVVEGREIFSWAGARRFETHDVSELVGSGASSSGEFGFFLASVFGSAREAFRYGGRRNDFAIFEYNVPAAKSSYSYRAYGPGKTTGFHGTFSVDPSDGDLHQLVVESEQFAPSDAVCRVQHVMDYNRVKIGSGDFLLPEVSTMEVLYRRGAESLNETRYSDCREYVGESTIRFDDVGAAAGPAVTRAALQPLPPKVRLLIGLSRPIDTEIAAAGDGVEGVLLRDVTDKKQRTLAKANDRVHGRILRLRQFMGPAPRWFVAIRFDTIERNGMELPIALKPVDDGHRSAQRVRGPVPQSAMQRPEGGGVFVFAESGNIILDQGFHSEWETR
ncbi:MAG: hypothetical protein ABSG41_22420 [Bryobacteraceae bacterium]